MSEQRELVAKFAKTWSLNVAERKSLAGKAISGSLLTNEIASILDEAGAYPLGWRKDGDYSGGYIERSGPACYTIYWKAEVGIQRYQLQKIEQFDSAAKAASAFARRFFGEDFDGIPVNWTS